MENGFVKYEKMKIFLSLFFMAVVLTAKTFDVLKTGDLVFRNEDSFLSKVFRSFDNSEYSHVGVVDVVDGYVYILHSEFSDMDDGLKYESIDSFLSNAVSYMVLRLKNSEGINFKENIKNLLEKSPRFDFGFDYINRDKLYCTELVVDVYEDIVSGNIYDYLSEYNGKKYISTRSIYSNDRFKVIMKSK